MRRLIALMRLCVVLAAPVGFTGCASFIDEERPLPAKWREFWHGDTTTQLDNRAEKTDPSSEDVRTPKEEWRRPWFTDMAVHLTPERVHGGIVP